MNKIKIFTHGAKCEWCQLSRIERGFISLGHELTKNLEEADLIFSNNPWWEDIIEAKQAGKINGKIIFNILDIPEHLLHEFPLEKLKKQIAFADKVTCISFFVQGQTEKYLNTKSEVIYQPIMNINYNRNNYKKYKYLFIGRINDKNKRNLLALQALQILGAKQEDVMIVGPEYMGFGDYYGIKSEEELSIIYNCVDFVFSLGKIEGLSLVPWETISSGYSVPIVCEDMTTANEFFRGETFLIPPNPTAIAKFIASFESEVDIRNYSNGLNIKYSNFIKENLKEISVAQKILNLYYGIRNS
jgi:hypothetical protein